MSHMPAPTQVKVSQAVFEGISAAWLSNPKLREQVAATAAWCEKNKYPEAGAWIKKYEFRYGEAVYYGLVSYETGEFITGDGGA